MFRVSLATIIFPLLFCSQDKNSVFVLTLSRRVDTILRVSATFRPLRSHTCFAPRPFQSNVFLCFLCLINQFIHSLCFVLYQSFLIHSSVHIFPVFISYPSYVATCEVFQAEFFVQFMFTHSHSIVDLITQTAKGPVNMEVICKCIF